MERTCDVAVIGAGPGGYTAAIRAAQLGASVCLVERDHLGGTCTNRGCIPTKALAASAHLLKRAREADRMGVRINGEIGLDFQRVAERRDGVVDTLRQGIAGLIKAHKIDLLSGTASLTGPDRLRVAGGEPVEVNARNIILATGSFPARLPMLPVDGTRVVTSDEILQQTTLPRRLTVIGGGVIGCEFASIYSTFGVEVTVVELLDRLLPTLDPALASVLKRAFKQSGIEVHTGVSVQGIEPFDDRLEVVLPEGKRIITDQVLVSVGRRPATADLGLEQAGVTTERGAIRCDELMHTGVAGIHAIGDAVGRTWLAHVAAREGEVAAANCLGENEAMDYTTVPAVVYTDPEIACVGLMPAEARKQGRSVLSGKFFYNGSGKALCDEVAEGRVEILADAESGQVLGGWVSGDQASVLIAEIAMAVDQKLQARQIADLIHAHPSLPEMVAEAAADTYGLAIHRAAARRRR